ncbi:hypothetical protein PAXRUDRAFT_181325, partial [Paxillus rubicundulus Ve08.2h10]
WEFPAMWEFQAINVGPFGISHYNLLACVGIPSHVCRSPRDFPLYAIDLGGNSQPSMWEFPAINVGPSGISHYNLLAYVGIPSHVCISISLWELSFIYTGLSEIFQHTVAILL